MKTRVVAAGTLKVFQQFWTLHGDRRGFVVAARRGRGVAVLTVGPGGVRKFPLHRDVLVQIKEE